ncbi:hypothetical protein G7054_g7686 [Neopestalotiopsis clavispora]|nr:hypothetical protein G7054_g7686 [Neopestalotiopsis clavispora]
MVRLLVLILGILPAIVSAEYYAGPSVCHGPVYAWVFGCWKYPPAESYCSSHFQRTTTKTVTAPTRTLTTTVATSTSTSTLAGIITTVVGEAPTTTVTVFSTVYTTSTATLPEISTTTTTSTSTVTVSSTSTVRSLVPTAVKRSLKTGAPAYADLLRQGRPIIERVCSCIVPGAVTTTKTITPTNTKPATAVTTRSVSNIVSVPFTPTVTVTSTITSAADPETVITTFVSTATEVTTTTTTVVTTVVAQPPKCDPNSKFGSAGAGGCSSNCYCDRDIDGLNYFCDSSIFCISACQSDDDCSPGHFCATGTSCSSTGGRTCQRYSDCTSTFTPRLRRGGSNVGLEAVAAVERGVPMAAAARDEVKAGGTELSHQLE